MEYRVSCLCFYILSVIVQYERNTDSSNSFSSPYKSKCVVGDVKDRSKRFMEHRSSDCDNEQYGWNPSKHQLLDASPVSKITMHPTVAKAMIRASMKMSTDARPVRFTYPSILDLPM